MVDDLKLRDRLTALAGEMPPQTAVPPGLVRRARRRGALVMGAAVVSVVALAVLATVGVRTLLRAEPTRPAVTGPIVPGPTPGDGITVVVAGESGAPNGAITFDPDSGAADGTEMLVGRTALPLAWSPGGRSP